MALTQLTKVDGGGISTTSDYRVGIITASKFVGPFDGSGGNFSGVITATNGVFSGNISAVDGNFSGNVTIGGTLTYEDVTNIDSVGIITAQKDIHVGAGVSVVGIVTAATFKGDGDFVDIDVDGHTNLDNVSVAGVSTFASDVAIGRSMYHVNDIDTSIGFPVNGTVRISGDNERVADFTGNYGGGGQVTFFKQVFVSGGTVNIAPTIASSTSPVITIRNASSHHTVANFQNTNNASSIIQWNNYNNTSTAGNLIFRSFNSPNTEYARFTGAGNFNLLTDLDVDGHTNLDNVSVAGVTTITKGSSGGATPNTDSVLTLDNSSHNYIQFRSPNNKEQGLLFGDDADNDAGNIIYNHSANALTFATNGGTNERLRIDSTGHTTIYSGAHDKGLDILPTANSRETRLRIQGKASDGTEHTFTIAGKASSNSLFLSGTGPICFVGSQNVGVQNGVPTSPLHVGDDTNPHTTKALLFVGPASGDGTFHLRGGSPTVFFDSTSGGDAKILLDGRDLIIKDGTFDTSNNGNELLRIASDGVLKIERGSASDTALEINTTSTSNACRIKFNESGSNKAQIAYSHDNDRLELVSQSGNGIAIYSGGNLVWKFDTNGHLLPNSAGAVNIGSASAEIGNVFVADSKKVFLGSDQDIEIYHDNTHGYLKNVTGNFFISNTGSSYSYIDSNYFRVRNSSGNHMLEVNSAGANQGVRIFHTAGSSGGGTLKTTSSGIDVTGEVAATQDFPVVKPVLDFNFAVEKKLDPRFTFYRRGTASYVDKKGIVRYASSNEPRFDHHPTTGASLGFLVEKQQSNYQPYSVDMDAGAPYKNAVTVINDAAIAPDGTMSASKIIGSDNQSTSQRLGWTTQTVPNSSYTMWSIWLKSEETSCIIQVYSNTYTFGADHLNVELADGTTGGHNNIDGNFRYNLEKYPNNWWRLSWGGNGQGGSGGMYVAVVPSISSTRAANTGSAHSKVWYAWGVQEEVSTESRIASSYIPTYGSTATRYGDYAQMQDDDFDDFFDRFQGTVINEHSNALQSYGGGGSGWEFQNNQFQTNLITSTGSGYAHASYPGCHASVFGDRGSNGSGNGSGNDYVQAYGPNDADAQNAPANTGNGRYPSNGLPDYTRYYRTWIDAMSYDVTPSENILRVATGGASSYVGGNTQNISLANISKLEIGNGASQLGYSSIYGRIKRWVYYDKVLSLSQLRNLTAQLPNSYL